MVDLKKLFGFMVVAWFVGIWLGWSINGVVSRTQAIKQECAHYDPKTAEFKWGPLQ